MNLGSIEISTASADRALALRCVFEEKQGARRSPF